MKNRKKKLMKVFFSAGALALFGTLFLSAQQGETFSGINPSVPEIYAQTNFATPLSLSKSPKKSLASSSNANHSYASPSSKTESSIGGYAQGELLVKHREEVDDTTLSTKMSVNRLRQIGLPRYGQGYKKYEIQDGSGVEEKIRELSLDPDVLHAQPNFIYHTRAIPNDPEFGRNWALKNTGQTVPGSSFSTNNPGTSGKDMDMELAWDITTDCSTTTVAVIDSGINFNHEEFAGNLWDGGINYPNHGADFTGNNDNDPTSIDGHGTHVAGIIGARGNNGKGMTGVCWGASIMAVKIFPQIGNGAFTSDIIEGLNFAVRNGAKVVNMSFGATHGTVDVAYADAVKNAANNDVLIVVAAGNSNTNHNPSSGTINDLPCDFTTDNILCVAALDQAYSRASFSDFGKISVDVGAPGTNIYSAWPITTITKDTFGDRTSGAFFPSANSVGLSPLTSGIYAGRDLIQIPPQNLFDATTWNNYPFKYSDISTSTLIQSTINLENPRPDYVSASFNFKSDLGDSTQDAVLYCTEIVSQNPPQNPICNLLPGNATSIADNRAAVVLNNRCSSDSCVQTFLLHNEIDGKTGHGLEIVAPQLHQYFFKTDQYNTINGTSFASPHVAGLAAMLRSFNPEYTYADTSRTIRESGEDNPSLANITTTGKSVNAFNALTHVLKPEFTGTPTVTE